MATATWKGVVLAESDATHTVEGNIYFPPDSIRREHLIESDTTSRCIWKGKARYYHVRVGDLENRDAAWSYPSPWPLARKLRDHVAFWKGVEVEA